MIIAETPPNAKPKPGCLGNWVLRERKIALRAQHQSCLCILHDGRAPSLRIYADKAQQPETCQRWIFGNFAVL